MAEAHRQLALTRPLVAFDLETTGLAVADDRVVEISCVKLNPDGTREVRTRRLNPERPISAEASAVHGITDADVANEPTFRQVGRSLFDFLQGCDLTGFNVTSFDLPLLANEFRRIGLTFPGPEVHVVDSRKIYLAKEPRTLSAAYAFYCGKNLDDAHSAEADAVAAADVLVAQVVRYDDLPVSVTELDAFCQPRKSNWVDASGKLVWQDGEAALGFGKHRGRTLKAMLAEDRGYLEWITGSDFPPDVKAIVSDALGGKMPTR